MTIVPSIAQNLILLSFVSSKPFSDGKSVEISRTGPRFSKTIPHWIFFFEKFQNYRRELANSSFDRKFHTEKLYNGTFFDKINMWGDMASYVILFMYDVTKSLKIIKWRHIFSHVHFMKKCPVIKFFRMKFRVEWAIWEVSTIILKIFEK